MHNIQKVILVGLGKVGREVLKQLQNCDLKFEFTGLVDSSACLVGQPLSVDQIQIAVQAKEAGKKLADLDGALPQIRLTNYFSANSIIVDTSAASYLDWSGALQKGSKLVFANKNAHSAPWLQAANLYDQPKIRYEATVGAGLPVITTLRGQVESGDKITHIEGVMSGTLGYICSQLEQGMSYSQAVRHAFESGYSEPDPRDDLSGFDVLRKAIILARTAGWQLEQEDFRVEPMYDDELLGDKVSEFLENTGQLDQAYSQQVEEAANKGRVLRYLATITPTGGDIGLKAVGRKSQLGALHGTGNYFAIYSEYYNEIPMVIAGPGAGIEVTANGVLNDIIALLTR